MNVNSLVQGAVAKVESLPSPVGGWNARDSFANMDPSDAVNLDNMFPTVSNVVLRGGSTKWSTGLDGEVQTLMTYSGGPNTKLFAITETGKIYDVTAGGAVGSPVVSGLSNGIWEYTNISTAGGSFLVAVNGLDDPRLYDGTTWMTITASTTPSITGIGVKTLVNIVLFKNRLWFIEKDTLRAWYLPTNSLGGAAQQIDMSAIARFGGHLVNLDTWTLDAGYGVDDNLVFVTSEGEVIVWSGTDPASITTWSLIGVWKLGSPIGQRCMLKWGGDLLILTYDGLMPMAGSLQSSRLDPRVALSDKIQGAITQATTDYGGDHAAVGWEIVYNAKRNAVWINIPVAPAQQEQYAMNTITKSWCRFTGWGANCWAIFKDDPYFGGDGFVSYAWDTTYADDGANIQTNVLQAFNYFGERGVKKYFTRAQLSLFTNGTPSVFVGLNVDFNVINNAAPISYTGNPNGVWDTGKWDAATWGGEGTISNTWLGITGIGYCGAMLFKSSSAGISIEWASTDVVYQTGWSGI